MTTKSLKATCLCGSAKHELTLATSALPLPLTFCHCNSCRHVTGTLCLTVAVLPTSYSPSSHLVAQLTVYELFERITDYFCSTCGTRLLFYVKHSGGDPDSSGYWAVHTGTLEQADGVLAPDVHWFIADTVDGGFADFFPNFREKALIRYAGFKGRSERLPLHWKSPEEPEIISPPSEKLRCHCRCGGVEFWIARPSTSSKEDLHRSVTLTHDQANKYHANVCCCNSCRLDSGMEWMEWAVVPTGAVTLDAEGKVPLSLPFATLKDYRSSQDVLRYHCATCGAPSFHQNESSPDVVDAAVGLMNAPEGARAENWLEWSTKRLRCREDALSRAEELTVAVETGLLEYGRRRTETEA